MTADKAADAGSVISIVFGVASWFGAHLPQMLAFANLVLALLLIVKYSRDELRRDRKG